MNSSTEHTAEIDFRAGASAEPASWGGVAFSLRHELHDNRILFVLCVLFVVATNLILDRVAGETPKFVRQLPVSLMMNATMAAYVGILQICVYLIVNRPNSPLRALAGSFGASRGAIIARAIIFIPLASIVLATFSRVKQNIGELNPFWLDKTFISWDALIHGGHQPWELLQPLFGRPFITDTLDYLYYCWFPVFYLTFFWQAFRLRDPALRRQYMLAFFACWILIGSAAAFFLSSAGPAFLDDLKMNTGPFDGLLAYLNQAGEFGHSINAVVVQHTLWQAYTTDFDFPYEGISAMPSMHVAIATLMALLAWRISRVLGAAYTCFAVLIFCGSILLAFHYAVDGYVAALMAAGIWLVAGRMTRDKAPAAPVPVHVPDANDMLRARVAKLMLRPS